MLKKLLYNFIKKKKFEKKIEIIYKKSFKNGNVKGVFTHQNDTFVIYNKDKKIFKKFSFTLLGKTKIINDYNGLKWYCKKSKVDLKNIINNYEIKNKPFFIETFKIKGKKIKSWDPLHKNYKYIKLSLNHYKRIFSYKEKTKIHGDLTLENIFLQDEKVFFIDWEFFNSKKKLWGYDAVYLVLSSIAIPFLVKKSFSNKDKDLFLKLWKMLLKMPINPIIINDPFNYFKKAINSDNFLKKSSKISKKKFFPLITPLYFQKQINDLITKGNL